ncbi:hypothetical protein PTKIN_Ptkin09bG0186600 [Pterospermum kingtungense]
MDLVNGEMSVDLDELLQAEAHVWTHIFKFLNSMSLKCAVELEIPDIIHNHGQPMTLSQLATALPIHPTKIHCLHRLMRVLVHSGFFEEQQVGEEKGYVLTPASRLLLKDNPFTTRPLLLAALDPVLLKSGHYMSTWFQNDDPSSFNTAYGSTFWEYASQDPRLNRCFNEAMAGDSNLIGSVVVSKFKGVFEGLKSVVDVGGGTGCLAKIIAKAFPHLDCIVFDLPHVVDGLRGCQNLKFVGGNMFEGIPPADAIILKWVLHDWNDEDCVKILKQCKEAIGSKDKGGPAEKVIIIDMIMTANQVKAYEDSVFMEPQLLLDMQMMTLCQMGQERSEEEWSKLFADAGFKDYKINSNTLGLRSLIELYP